MKKVDEFKAVREKLTPTQLSFFLKLDVEKNRLSVKEIGKEFYTADAYVYKVIDKLAKLDLIDVEKGIKKLIINITDYGREFIKSSDFSFR